MQVEQVHKIDVGTSGEKKAGIVARYWKLALFVLLVAALIVLGRVFALGEKLKAVDDYLEGRALWARMAIFIPIYIGATVGFLPGIILTVAAGAIFYPVIGIICVSIASTVGASLCFLIARYLARDTVTNWLSGNEKFEKLDEMTGKHGNIMVAITRLVPIFPFNLLNYGFGLTRVPFWTYAFWSWLCMLPGTILYVVAASAVKTGVKEGKVPWVLIAVVVSVIAILTLLVRHAKRTLREREGKAEETGNG